MQRVQGCLFNYFQDINLFQILNMHALSALQEALSQLLYAAQTH
jgi:hypothetical protein